jgi:SnoaL-like domain
MLSLRYGGGTREITCQVEPMLMIGALCLALLVPGGIMDQAGQQADEQEIHGVLNGFVDAWNQHDAKAFAAVFSGDADFTNWRGMGASGRANVEAFHAPCSPPSSRTAIRHLVTARSGLFAPTLPRWMFIGQ